MMKLGLMPQKVPAINFLGQLNNQLIRINNDDDIAFITGNTLRNFHAATFINCNHIYIYAASQSQREKCERNMAFTRRVQSRAQSVFIK